MGEPALTEKELTAPAEKALRGDSVGAVAALVSVLTAAASGHPLLGVALGSGTEWFVKSLLDRATPRLLEAEQKHDDEQARVDSLARELAVLLAPFTASKVEELGEQSRDQFLQTLRFLERNTASAAGQQELLAGVRELTLALTRLSPARSLAQTPTSVGATVFVCYSSKDAIHRDAFRRAARRLEASGLASVWHDAETRTGEPWAQRIREQLERARLVVALVSSDSLESPWCTAELARTFELRERRLVDVVPVVVRPCEWRATALGAIQALPRGGAPIASLPDAEAGWEEVVAEIESILSSGVRVQPALPSRAAFVHGSSERLEASRRLMLLAPWRDGLAEVAQDIARRSHGDRMTTLRLPAFSQIEASRFYAEVSGEPGVKSREEFRDWLMRRSSLSSGAPHLLVLPYFGGPRELVKELGDITRGVFDELGTFSLLVLGMGSCAALRYEVERSSLFSGISAAHLEGLDLAETRTLLARHGADPTHAERVHMATGGHPEWTALASRAVREGRRDGLHPYLSDVRVYDVVRERLVRKERDRRGNNHAARTLAKLLRGERVVRLSDVSDDLSFPEVRLYYDGLLIERDGQTAFRCEAVRLASARALEVWSEPA